jgi:hypothetical protein
MTFGNNFHLEGSTGKADSGAQHATNLGVCRKDHIPVHPGVGCPGEWKYPMQ